MPDLKAALKRRAEKLEWNWKDCDDGSVELETWSPAGEDIIVELPGEDIVAISTFYAIWDYIREVAGDLEHLEGDCRVVDAIYAVNDVRRRESTLTTE